MKRYDDQMSDRRLMAGFAAAGVILFAGTLLVGFSARDIDRKKLSPSQSAPSKIVDVSTSG